MREIWRKQIYEKVKEDRGNYFVVYHPINLIDENIAVLQLVFTSSLSIEHIAIQMEEELEIWISKYPLPIIVFAYDETGSSISLETVRPSNGLHAYMDNGTNNIIKSWDRTGEGVSFEVTDELITCAYQGLPNKAREKKEKERDKAIKETRLIKKLLDFSVLSWLSILIIISFLGWQNYWVGAIAFFYSFYKLIRRYLEIKGYRNESQIAEDEIRRKKEHYYYHCEKNPEGFLKLKIENFEKEEKDKIKQEKASIKIQ